MLSVTSRIDMAWQKH